MPASWQEDFFEKLVQASRGIPAKFRGHHTDFR